ncbi:MAG: DMT family transporter [Gemmataceae bacterium]|nr:DMT family transporter [Gemmataceae bacterium]
MSGSSILPYIWMVLGCLSFSIMSELAHHLKDYCDWQVAAIFRSFLVFVFVTIYGISQGTKFVYFSPPRLWIRSIAGSLSLIGGYYALNHLPASTVSTLTNTFPIWVALLSWPLLGTWPSIRVWIAVFGGVIGVSLIRSPEGLTQSNDWPFVIALASALATAIAMIGLHRLKNFDTNAIVVHFSAVATLFCIACFFLFERHRTLAEIVQPLPLLMLLGVGVSATFGQIFLTKAFAQGDPAKVSVVGLSQVLFTLVIDLIWGEVELTQRLLLGTLMVLLPTALVMLERKKIPTAESRRMAVVPEQDQ